MLMWKASFYLEVQSKQRKMKLPVQKKRKLKLGVVKKKYKILKQQEPGITHFPISLNSMHLLATLVNVIPHC
ncbi:hypothetical protein RHMOL_Rhmol06G0164300 [Rhododendron molle]|uniref:Uncharacterized protein n=1 Tax=Rhododendron molle TaxID=49168 RepID=A0ACC0NEF0_RHOML|nr:hypothetical protein RHMOL_Rhmol06G0164300 [Rhododendron molle]